MRHGNLLALLGAAMLVAPQSAGTQTVSAELAHRPLAPTYPLNDTGQTDKQCYQSVGNALTVCALAAATSLYDRQDGMIGRDVTHNDNSDGAHGFSFTKLAANGAALPNNATSWACVKDNVTGLVWEAKSDSGIHDKTKRYDFYASPTIASLAAATNSENLCGRTGWRVPTWFELLGIVDFGAATPAAIDTNWFRIDVPTGATSLPYWTSTAFFYADDSRDLVDFIQGGVTSQQNLNSPKFSYVRLVNGAQPSNVGRFQISADGQEVTDRRFGLIWRRCLEGLTWNGALACLGPIIQVNHHDALLHAQGQKGWRIPNIKELSTIFDQKGNRPGVDVNLFPQPLGGSAWTSTAARLDSNFVMAALVLLDPRSANHTIRLVRDMPQGPQPR